MSLISKYKKLDDRVVSENTFPKLGDTIFGGKVDKLNRNREVFTSDYFYVFIESEDDNDDKEMGINKNYHKFHDIDNSDVMKHEDFKEYRDERRIRRKYGL